MRYSYILLQLWITREFTWIYACMVGSWQTMVDDRIIFPMKFHLMCWNQMLMWLHIQENSNSHMRFTPSTHHILSHIIMTLVFYAWFSDDCFRGSKIIETIDILILKYQNFNDQSACLEVLICRRLTFNFQKLGQSIWSLAPRKVAFGSIWASSC